MSGALISALGGLISGLLLAPLLRRRQTIPAATVDENGNWCFPMDTLEQMLAVPVERRARFLDELPLMFGRIWEMQDKYPLATLPGAVWVDDRLGELRPQVDNAPAGTEEAFSTRPLGGKPA